MTYSVCHANRGGLPFTLVCIEKLRPVSNDSKWSMMPLYKSCRHDFEQKGVLLDFFIESLKVQLAGNCYPDADLDSCRFWAQGYRRLYYFWFQGCSCTQHSIVLRNARHLCSFHSVNNRRRRFTSFLYWNLSFSRCIRIIFWQLTFTYWHTLCEWLTHIFAVTMHRCDKTFDHDCRMLCVTIGASLAGSAHVF